MSLQSSLLMSDELISSTSLLKVHKVEALVSYRADAEEVC